MAKLIFKQIFKSNLSLNLPLYTLHTLILIYIIINPSEVIAGIFDPPITDKSVEYLGIMFGGAIGGLHLGTSLQTSSILGNLFEKINGIVIALATVILLYTSILSVINTAQDGEIMGKKWSSIWIPLRSSMGLLLLAPIPGSGYSLIQVTVMWIVLNGIGAADSIWNLVADSIAVGINVIQNDNKSIASQIPLILNAANLAPNVFRSLVCVELLNKYLPPDINSQFLGGNPGSYFTTPTEINGKLTGYLKFGVESASGGYNAMQDICGSITIDIGPSIASEVQSIVDTPLTTAQKTSIQMAAFETKKTALTSMLSSMNNLANLIANVPDNDTNALQAQIKLLLDNPSLLSSALLSFQGIMSDLNKEQLAIKLGLKIKSTNQNLPTTLENMKATGWILAGSYYFLFNQQNTKVLLSTINQDLPNGITGIDKGQINVLNSSISMAELPTFNDNKNKYPLYYQQLNNTELTKLFQIPQAINNSIGNVNSFFPKESMNKLKWTLIPLNPIALGPLIGFLDGLKDIVDDLTDVTNNMNIDPMVTISNAGKRMMELSEQLWIALTYTMMGLSMLMGVLAGCNPFFLNFLSFLINLMPALIGTLIIVWGFGALLGIYIPLVPFMIFAMTVISWFISVVEAIVAAPLVALGLILPSQEELGAVKHALEMIANIFLKPMLIIIGLLFSSKLLKILLLFITLGFKNTTSILNSSSIFSWLCVLGIYTGFIIALINKSYSLIYHLPDKVLKWIGVAEGGTDVGAIEQAKSFHEQTTSTIKSQQSQSTDPAKKMGESMGKGIRGMFNKASGKP